jgi:hypothetical protein
VSQRILVVATMRSDFFQLFESDPRFSAAKLDLFNLPPLSKIEFAEVTRRSAEVAGVTFEVSPRTGLRLDEWLATDASATPGSLPVLSYALKELYKDAKVRGETVLTYASFEVHGGVGGAIARRANEVLAYLPEAAQAALPRVLRALITVTGLSDGAPVPRSVPLDSFAEGSPARILVDAFLVAELLVAGGEPVTMVQLAHEVLIDRWDRARNQLAEDRRDLETGARVKEQCHRWRNARGNVGLLLRNPDLADAVDLAERWGDALDAPIREFIKQSVQRARFAQTLNIAAAVLFVLLASAAFYWWRAAQCCTDSITQ